jgi:hypothetical protein
VRAIKSWWLILAFLSGFALAMWAEEVILNWRDNRLEFSAPRVHFLEEGKPTELLHNAEAVPFGFQVTLWSGNRTHIFRRLQDEFVVSYDLWEEKFRVVKTQSPVRKVSHLSAADAEKWCWDQMAMDVSGIAGNEPLWVRLDVRAEDDKRSPLFPAGSVSESGISLTSLIELFSQPPRRGQTHWGPYDLGPFTLDELKNSPHRSVKW